RGTPESPSTSVSTPEVAATTTNCDAKTKGEHPAESPNSYVTRELAETRRRLVERSNVAAADGMPECLSDVIAHLDRLLATETSSYVNRNKKVEGTTPSASCPPTRPGLPSLPPINEENDTTSDGV